MSGLVLNRVRAGFYMDSVALMRLSARIAALPGVSVAALMMGTPANREILMDAGLLTGESEVARGGDLIIALRANDQTAGAAALATADELLRQPTRTEGGGQDWRPKTLRSAVKIAPDANLALISVPGDFAAAEARKALRRGLNVMLFSDNVPLDAEVELKREARERGLLVMGPDCGTAILNGTPVAFANRVARGEVGIVGASGTGIQEVSCLISRHGGGVSHAIGVGGRDLSDEVGGISTLTALDALAADPATRHVVLISKPPGPATAWAVLDRLKSFGMPCTVCFPGASEVTVPANTGFTATLKHAAESALGHALPTGPEIRLSAPAGRWQVRGLFSGGTLAAEARAICDAAGGTHRIVDLGDDAYTRGRPHPMIAPERRLPHLVEALDDPAVGVVLLDVVLGFGAHPDPAAVLADALSKRESTVPLIIASVVGTDEDPQNRARQAAKLEAAGVTVAPSNADAVTLALGAILGQG